MQKTLSYINLSQIRENALTAKKLAAGKKFFAVVKADAYGHGAEEVSRFLEDIVDGFCVAIIDEGVALRIAGVTKQILVFTPPLDSFDVVRAAAYNLTLTVNSVNTARLINGAPCHIKVNTGMNRLGCDVGELHAVIKALPFESIEGVYSHLFAPQDDAASLKQLALFDRAVKIVKYYSPHAVSHIAASGGILKGGRYLCDCVRCGILLYGYTPDGFKADVKPALGVYARRTQVTRFIGGGVGYNFAEKNYGYLTSYRCGYADGFIRGVPLGEKTLCMDAFVANGRGEELLPVMTDARKYADRCGTIPYEVLTSVTRRSERIYER